MRISLASRDRFLVAQSCPVGSATLLTLKSHNNLSGMSHLSELEVPDSLPGSGGQISVLDGDIDGHADQRRSNVSRHVIGALATVSVDIGLRSNSGQSIGHICSHVCVPVLVESQSSRGVLHEEVGHADLVVLDLRHLADNLVGHQVRSLGLGGQSDCLLCPGHCVCLCVEKRCGG